MALLILLFNRHPEPTKVIVFLVSRVCEVLVEGQDSPVERKSDPTLVVHQQLSNDLTSTIVASLGRCVRKDLLARLLRLLWYCHSRANILKIAAIWRHISRTPPPKPYPSLPHVIAELRQFKRQRKDSLCRQSLRPPNGWWPHSRARRYICTREA